MSTEPDAQANVSEEPQSLSGPPDIAEAEKPSRKPTVIPESLRLRQKALLKKEAETDEARKLRNIEVARLRDVEQISQYRISKWLGVTERAVMLMAKQGRESVTE